MRTLAVGLTLALFGAVLLAESTLDPTRADREQIYSLFAISAAISAVAYAAVRYVMARARSLASALLLTSVAALGVSASGVGYAAATMTLSQHDSRVILATLAAATALSVSLALALAKSLRDDLHRVKLAARRLAAGETEAPTGVIRVDEIGALAAAIDAMSSKLSNEATKRTRAETAHRRLLADIGHDLRTPLTSLRAAIEALQDGVVRDQDRYLTAMAADVRLLTGLVNDLFILARVESGDIDLRIDTFDLVDLVGNEVEAMRVTADRLTLTIEFEYDEECFVDADTDAFRRVVRNLLDNALRHAPPGSTVHVRVVGLGGRVVMSVRDEGHGFPEAFRASAFDPGTRADAARSRSAGGAGLGLAIARAFVLAFDGAIRIEGGAGGHVVAELPESVTTRRVPRTWERLGEGAPL